GALQGALEEVVGEQRDERVGAVNEMSARGGRVVEIHDHFAVEVLFRETFTERCWQVFRDEAPRLAGGFQRGIEPLTGRQDKTRDGGLIADQIELAAPLGQDLLGTQSALSEDGAIRLRLLASVFPRGFQGL